MRFGGCVSATCCYCCCSVDPPLRCPRSRFQSRITGDENNQTDHLLPGDGNESRGVRTGDSGERAGPERKLYGGCRRRPHVLVRLALAIDYCELGWSRLETLLSTLYEVSTMEDLAVDPAS